MVKVKTKYGIMDMPILKQYIKEHETMQFEREFLDIIESEFYDLFIDIGAGWGYFSIPASHFCKAVLAFEPHPERFKILERNISRNKCDKVVLIKSAVGTGEIPLFINRKPLGMVGNKTKGRQESFTPFTFELKDFRTSLDSMRTLIKVDVEGNELDVIQSIGCIEEYTNLVWLIERHQTYVTEEELFKVMHPYKGELLGTRKQTSHYVFRRE